jgi:hypothetical protein
VIKCSRQFAVYDLSVEFEPYSTNIGIVFALDKMRPFIGPSFDDTQGPIAGRGFTTHRIVVGYARRTRA